MNNPVVLIGEALRRLGVGQLFSPMSPVAAELSGQLVAWIRAGYPERSKEEIERLSLAPCEHRTPGGMCRKAGCGKERNHIVPCLCFCRMATADCPADMFRAQATRQPRGG
jgi:hypothetical protein